MSDWQMLVSSGILGAIDLRFAAFCRQLAEGDDLVGISAALLSCERGRGNSCVELGQWQDKTFPFDELAWKPGYRPELPQFPDATIWRDHLRDWDLIGDGSRPTPLVLDQSGRLYLYRYWCAERRIADFICEKTGTSSPLGGEELSLSFRALFEPFSAPANWQAAAALTALLHPFSIITGGPGTGKTTTVVKVLALLLQREANLRIALAAPTGKAASRLSESISGHIAQLRVSDEIRAKIPCEVKTLHRLLGYRPRLDRFYHNNRKPLPFDAVVVDEASMVDILLMENLIRALAPRCRLVLLGDHDQLASVDTGFVLGDITRAAGIDQAHGLGFNSMYERLTGYGLPGAQADPPPLRDAVVYLRESYRFKEDSGIGALSFAIRDQNAAQIVEILARFPDVVHQPPPANADDALGTIMADLEHYMAATSPQEALVRFGQSQVLCGLRSGPWGVENVNAAVERCLKRLGHDLTSPYYRGRPVLITRNDYPNNLFNGDVGICWPMEGRPRVFFPEISAPPRDLSVSRLPAHETAWAMTVHKNQGSEFERVLLILPEASHPLCNRELFYTGVTRAKKSLHLIAEPAAIQNAAHSTSTRTGGLTDLLSH